MNKDMLDAQIDFDGVIHKARRGYSTGEIYDVPNEGAVFTITNALKAGKKLEILTSRPPEDWPKIKKWMKKYKIPELEVSNIKKPAKLYPDNRGLRFINWVDLAYYLL